MAQDPDLMRVVGEAVMALGTDIVFVVDAPSLRIVRANLAFTHVLGYPSDEVSRLTIRELSAADPKVIEATLATLVETGQVPLSVRPFRRKDGTVVEIESSVGRTVVDGRVLYCVVGRDPTERHRAERARREGELRMRTFVDAAFEGIDDHRQGPDHRRERPPGGAAARAARPAGRARGDRFRRT